MVNTIESHQTLKAQEEAITASTILPYQLIKTIISTTNNKLILKSFINNNKWCCKISTSSSSNSSTWCLTEATHWWQEFLNPMAISINQSCKMALSSSKWFQTNKWNTPMTITISVIRSTKNERRENKEREKWNKKLSKLKNKMKIRMIKGCVVVKRLCSNPS